MALRNGRFGQLRGGASRRGGTHGHRMPIPALWGWVGAPRIRALRCKRPQHAGWRHKRAVLVVREGGPDDEVARTATECPVKHFGGGGPADMTRSLRGAHDDYVMRQRGCAVARAVARTVGELTSFGRSRLHDVSFLSGAQRASNERLARSQIPTMDTSGLDWLQIFGWAVQPHLKCCEAPN